MVAKGVLRTIEGGRLMFWCPGCECAHAVATGQGPGPRWSFNGDHDRPTFTPSILATRYEWEPSAVDPDIREKIRRGEIKQTEVKRVCHSFVTEGQIQFLSDCTHALAGQTVPLQPFDEASMSGEA